MEQKIEQRVIKFRLLLCGSGKLVGYERFLNNHWEWNYIELNPDKGERWTPGVIVEQTSTIYIRNQFTGLHDKNGVEIFEGDIVVHDGEECVINFKGGSFGIDFQETARKPYDRILNSTKWEVVGNIFQPKKD